MVLVQLGQGLSGLGIECFLGQDGGDVFRCLLLGRELADIAQHQHGGEKARLVHRTVHAAGDSGVDLLHQGQFWLCSSVCRRLTLCQLVCADQILDCLFLCQSGHRGLYLGDGIVHCLDLC